MYKLKGWTEQDEGLFSPVQAEGLDWKHTSVFFLLGSSPQQSRNLKSTSGASLYQSAAYNFSATQNEVWHLTSKPCMKVSYPKVIACVPFPRLSRLSFQHSRAFQTPTLNPSSNTQDQNYGLNFFVPLSSYVMGNDSST